MCTSRTRVLSAVECRRLRGAHGAEADSKHEPGGESNYAHVSCPRLGTTPVEKAWPGDVVRTRLPCAHGDRGAGLMGCRSVRRSAGQRELCGLVSRQGGVRRVQVATANASSRTSRDDNGLSTNIHNCPQGGFQMSPILHHLCEKFSTGGDGRGRMWGGRSTLVMTGRRRSASSREQIGPQHPRHCGINGCETVRGDGSPSGSWAM